MAKVNTNPLLNGLRGILGSSIVFKTWHGKTIVVSKPRPSKTQSPLQKANRNKFRDATLWAKTELKKPERKAYYHQQAEALQLPNAYTAAIKDYMRVRVQVRSLPSLY